MNDCKYWWKYKPKSCTSQQLLDLLREPSNGEFIYPIDSYNEVFDHIFIGDESFARNVELLKSLDIRHVLNAAFGTDVSLNLVNTSEELYSEHNISFLGIESIDLMSFDLYKFFEKSSQFIENSLKVGGNVLVHCKEGISRSATLVLSYLMIKKRFSAPEAIRVVRRKREIRPNDGFIAQLCLLNDKLFDENSEKVTKN